MSGILESFSISSTGNSLFVKFESDGFNDGSTGFLALIQYGNHYLNIKKFFKNIILYSRSKNSIVNTLCLVNCATANNGYDKFCYCNICSQNEGNCDAHDECQDGLACGSNNCHASLGFDSEVHCCYEPTLGDEDFCVTGITCGEDKGDCDSNIECQNSLFCGYNNCPVSLGFASEVDCCTSTQLVSPNYPNSYPNFAYEIWVIAAPTGSIINLQFHSFQVRYIEKFVIATR